MTPTNDLPAAVELLTTFAKNNPDTIIVRCGAVEIPGWFEHCIHTVLTALSDAQAEVACLITERDDLRRQLEREQKRFAFVAEIASWHLPGTYICEARRGAYYCCGHCYAVDTPLEAVIAAADEHAKGADDAARMDTRNTNCDDP